MTHAFRFNCCCLIENKHSLIVTHSKERKFGDDVTNGTAISSISAVMGGPVSMNGCSGTCTDENAGGKAKWAVEKRARISGTIDCQRQR